MLEPGAGAGGTFGLPPVPMFSWASFMPRVPSLLVSAAGFGGAIVVGLVSAARAPALTAHAHTMTSASRAARAGRVVEGG